jgi:hypothetical protein
MLVVLVVVVVVGPKDRKLRQRHFERILLPDDYILARSKVISFKLKIVKVHVDQYTYQCMTISNIVRENRQMR